MDKVLSVEGVMGSQQTKMGIILRSSYRGMAFIHIAKQRHKTVSPLMHVVPNEIHGSTFAQNWYTREENPVSNVLYN